MRCAFDFVHAHEQEIRAADGIVVELYGSLALTGLGHATDKAVVLGLTGHKPETIDPACAARNYQRWLQQETITVHGKSFAFRKDQQLVFYRDAFLPAHANGMIFKCLLNGRATVEADYYSIGGGFISRGDAGSDAIAHDQDVTFPYSFDTAAEVMSLAQRNQMGIDEMMYANELQLRDEADVVAGITEIWSVMEQSIDRGIHSREAVIPGGIGVKRRAPRMYQELKQMDKGDPLSYGDWLSLYAIAVNEENAAGGKVVTAPTNGAAGVIPAVLKYYLGFALGDKSKEQVEKAVMRYFLTTAAIGNLYKKNASISAAQMGCQGEIGVACSMATAGLTALRGGTVAQIENAAEIGMEHHLGLTCDPVGGLVQIPCIERNAVGSNTAVTASNLALRGDGTHVVGLDKVIKTMYETGMDMSHRYKETSLAGLAVSVIEC